MTPLFNPRLRGYQRLATFWLDNIPPINLWSMAELRAVHLSAPYKLSTVQHTVSEN